MRRVDRARLGAEFVIAVNVLPLWETQRPAKCMQDHLQQVRTEEPEGSPSSGEAIDDKLGPVEIVRHASRILASQIALGRLRDDAPGYLLQIPVPEVGVFEFHRTAELVELGRQTAEQALPELRSALARAVPVRRRLRHSLTRCRW